MNLAIVSVGLGNVASVKNMISKLGHQALLLSEPPEVDIPEIIILPGVGAYDNGITRLKNSGWYSWLKTHRDENRDNVKIIGICLGMQLLCDGSEEGDQEGLGLIPGFFKRFSFTDKESETLKIPHMGWSSVNFDRKKAFWAESVTDEARYYFVHSYYYSHEVNDYIIGTANYGGDFGAAIQNQNVIGFQFHPEKSHRFGKELLGLVLR